MVQRAGTFDNDEELGYYNDYCARRDSSWVAEPSDTARHEWRRTAGQGLRTGARDFVSRVGEVGITWIVWVVSLLPRYAPPVSDR